MPKGAKQDHPHLKRMDDDGDDMMEEEGINRGMAGINMAGQEAGNYKHTGFPRASKRYTTAGKTTKLPQYYSKGCDGPNPGDCVLKVQPTRDIMVPTNKALHMLQGFRTKDQARTPNQIYDMEQHEGYIKVCAEQGEFGFTWENADPQPVLFHHNYRTDYSRTNMQIASGTVDYQEVARSNKLPIWNTFKTQSNMENGPNFYFREYLTNWISQDKQQQEKTSTTSNLHQYRRMVGPANILPGNVPYNAVNKSWITHSGKMQMNYLNNRMPLVLIRVIPEMERTSNAYNLYHYLVNMQIEYFCEIEWIYPSPDPAYTRVGINGPWFRNTESQVLLDTMWHSGPSTLLDNTRRLRSQINKDTDGYPGDRFNWVATDHTTAFM
ncbi:hypothetical protein PoB_003073800 [Plakobranchus ocellatus]|uniref:Uncharacterized protein n=1 Tax=Plakobranchus ocellatus TaxID=259542 RepID=A0AAV4ABV4_9GAST|nr:hypothetical protein PoB_003073800 [Plakobranchus ocellatus]